MPGGFTSARVAPPKRSLDVEIDAEHGVKYTVRFELDAETIRKLKLCESYDLVELRAELESVIAERTAELNAVKAAIRKLQASATRTCNCPEYVASVLAAELALKQCETHAVYGCPLCEPEPHE